MATQTQFAVPAQHVSTEGLTGPDRVAVHRALISVYDKTGLIDLARSLVDAGVEIISTGSTAAAITAADLPVTSVEEVTGFPSASRGVSRPSILASTPGFSPIVARPST